MQLIPETTTVCQKSLGPTDVLQNLPAKDAKVKQTLQQSPDVKILNSEI